MAANTAFNLGFALAFALGFTFGADPLFPDVQEHDGISYNPSIDPDNGGHVVIRVPGQAAQHGKLTDFFTFTRSTSGTYRGRDGLLKTATSNVPRIEASGGTYDGNGVYTGYRLALLIEGARTNLNLHSADQTNAAWVKGNVTIGSNAVVAPDGTTTADNLVLSGGAGVHYTYQTQAKAASALAYVYSVWLRAGTGISEAQLFMTSDITTTNGVKTIVNLAAGTLSGTATIGAGWANAAATIDPWGNGWYRVTLSGTSDAIATITTFHYASIAGATNINSDGSFFTVWGSQLEQNAFPFATTYFGTTGAAGSRAADAAVRNVGAEVSSAAGTMILHVSVLGASQLGGSFAEIDNGSANESIWISDNGGGNLDLRVRAAAADVATYSTGAVLPPETRSRFGIAYALNDFIGVEDGVLTAPDTSGAAPVGLNNLAFGISNFGGTAYERIYGFDYWPERLPNAVFQALGAKP